MLLMKLKKVYSPFLQDISLTLEIRMKGFFNSLLVLLVSATYAECEAGKQAFSQFKLLISFSNSHFLI